MQIYTIEFLVNFLIPFAKKLKGLKQIKLNNQENLEKLKIGD